MKFLRRAEGKTTRGRVRSEILRDGIGVHNFLRELGGKHYKGLIMYKAVFLNCRAVASIILDPRLIRIYQAVI
jgi:hypothetical protein